MSGIDGNLKAIPVMVAGLREIQELHKPVEVEPSDTICAECSNQLFNGRYIPIVEWPCPTRQLADKSLGETS